MKDFLNELVDEFADADVAHAYMESHSVSRIAAQIYALRKQRQWSQSDLANRAGIAQERVSKIESADFTSLTMATLHKIARAFDVDVRIAFTSFSDGILDVAKLDPTKLQVCSRETDLARFKRYVSTEGWTSAGVTAPVQTSISGAIRLQSLSAPVVVREWQPITQALTVAQ